MASAQQAAIAEHLQCAVCLEQIIDSRLLSCQHTFCLACLNRLFQQSCIRMQITCPSCRQETAVSDAGPIALPKNRLVNQLIETLQASQVECHVCEDCDDESAAAGYCEQCELLLCDTCIRAHTRSKKNRAHSILAMPVYEEHCHTAGLPSLPVREPECSIHRGERTDVFCRTCEKAICYKCAAVQHQACEKGDLAEAFSEKKAIIANLIGKVEDGVVKSLQSAINATKQQQQMINASADKAERDIDHHFDNCQRLLQKRRQQLHHDVCRNRNAWDKCFQQTIDELTADFHSAMQVTAASNHTISFCTKSSVLSCAPETIDQLTSLHQGCLKLSERSLPNPQDINFVANTKALQDTLKKMGTVHTNKLTVHQMPTIALQNITNTFVVKCSPPTAPVVRVQPPDGGGAAEVFVRKHGGADDSYLVNVNLKAVGKHKVHVQVSGREMETVDKSFEVESRLVPDKPKKTIGTKGDGNYQFSNPGCISVCEENGILVADEENHRIQEFTSDGKLIRSFQSNGILAAATIHPSGVVLATNWTNHQVQVFSRDGQVRHVFGREGSKRGEYNRPVGIAVSNRAHMVVADCYNQRVQVVDIVTGTPIRQFSSCGRDQKLAGPYSVLVDPTDGCILVSNQLGHTVEEFTEDGQHVRSIGSGRGEAIGELNSPRDISLHPSGHLLVCEYNNHRVSMFTREGENVGLWGKVGGSPYGVACNKDGQVFISDYKKNCVHFY